MITFSLTFRLHCVESTLSPCRELMMSKWPTGKFLSILPAPSVPGQNSSRLLQMMQSEMFPPADFRAAGLHCRIFVHMHPQTQRVKSRGTSNYKHHRTDSQHVTHQRECLLVHSGCCWRLQPPPPCFLWSSSNSVRIYSSFYCTDSSVLCEEHVSLTSASSVCRRNEQMKIHNIQKLGR